MIRQVLHGNFHTSKYSFLKADSLSDVMGWPKWEQPCNLGSVHHALKRGVGKGATAMTAMLNKCSKHQARTKQVAIPILG